MELASVSKRHVSSAPAASVNRHKSKSLVKRSEDQMKTDALLCTVSSTGFTSLATKRSPIKKVPTNEVHNGMSVFFYAGSTAPCEGNAG